MTKPTKKLPSWIEVSASDPKLKAAVENKLAGILGQPSNIDRITLVANGRKFTFKDGYTEAFLWNDGLLWIDPSSTEDKRAMIESEIAQWKKASGFKPITLPTI